MSDRELFDAVVEAKRADKQAVLDKLDSITNKIVAALLVKSWMECHSSFKPDNLVEFYREFLKELEDE